MKQSEYLYELKENLEARVTQEELKDILSDYESFFVSGREDGKTDDEISKELGSPAFLAKSLLEEHSEKEVKQYYKRIANPGRRLCAYLIDAIIVVIPTLIPALIIGIIILPYLLFITYPSPAVGATTVFGLSAFTVVKSSTYEVTSVREINENGDNFVKAEDGGKVIKEEDEDKIIKMEKGKKVMNAESGMNGVRPSSITSIMTLLSLVFYLFYSLICTLLFRGQTIGKKIMHIKVRRSNTEPVASGAIFCREFLGKTIINSIPLIPLISLFTILFTKEHKALHDMISDTIVSDM